MKQLKFTLGNLNTTYSRPGLIVNVKLPKRLSAKRALEASIQKWEFLVKSLEEKPDVFIQDGSTTSCGLCQRYMDNRDEDTSACFGCPVQLETGKIYCNGSPYRKFADAVDKLRYHKHKPLSSAVLKEQKKWAKKELEFLKGLNP